jgi:hypothetical protein
MKIKFIHSLLLYSILLLNLLNSSPGFAQGCWGCLANPITGNDPTFSRDCTNGSLNWTSTLPKCDSTASSIGYFYLPPTLTLNGIVASDYSTAGTTQFMWAHIDTAAPVEIYAYKLFLAKDQTYCIDPRVAGIHSAPEGTVQIKISRLTLDSVLYSDNLVSYALGDSVTARFEATVSDTFTISIIVQRTGSSSLDVFIDDVMIREVYPDPSPVTISSAQTIHPGTANTLYASAGFNQYFWFENGSPIDTTLTDSLVITPDSLSAYYFVIGKDDNDCPSFSEMLPGFIITPGGGTCDCFISPNLVVDGDFSTWPHVPAITPGLNWYFGGTQINFAGGVQLPHRSPLKFHSLQTPGFVPTTPPSVNGDRAYYVYSTQMNQLAPWWLNGNVSSGVFICDMASNPANTGNFLPIWEQEIQINSQDDYCLSADVGFISYNHYQLNPPIFPAAIPIVDLCLQEINPNPGPPIIISGPLQLNNGNWNQLTGSANVTPGTYKIMIRAIQYGWNGSRGNDVIIDNVQMGTNSLTGAQISPGSIIPYCLNNPITLMEIAGNSGMNYSWSASPSGGISGSGQSILFTPTPSSSYTVTVTVTHPSLPGCGDVASVQIEPLKVDILTKGDFFCKGDPNPKIIQAQPSASISWLSYQWYFNNSLIPGSTQTTISVNTPGSYTVEINDGMGCTTTATVFMTEEDCCNHSAQLIPNGTTITSATLTGPSAIIQGTVSISGTVNWNGLNIFMGPNAQIDIPYATSPVNELIISGSTLRADCSIMWQGIVVQGDLSEWTPQGGLIVDQGSLIQDAIEAVRSEDNGPFLLHESTFDLNWVHVQVEDYTTIPIPSHFGNISGCKFDCSSAISLVPHIGGRTFIGVNINKAVFNWKEFNLTNQVLNYTSTHSSSTLPTLYRNADIGINAQNVKIFIANSEFKDFVCDPMYTNPCTLSYGQGTRAIQVESRGGFVYVYDNKFDNCHIGVLATSNDLTHVKRNQFRDISLFGVWCHLNPGAFLSKATCHINSNIFTNNSYLDLHTAAIRFTQNRGSMQADSNFVTSFFCGIVNDLNSSVIPVPGPSNPTTKFIMRENFLMNDHLQVNGYGIYSKEFYDVSSDIKHNVINARHTGLFTLSPNDKLRIASNVINMRAHQTSNATQTIFQTHPNQGIYMEGNLGSYVSDNEIIGQYLPTKLRAIEISSITDGVFCRNITRQSQINFLVKKPNFFTNLIDNEFFSASLNAIRFENFGNTGNQGFQSGLYVYSNKNIFNCGYSSTVHSQNSLVFNLNPSLPQSRYFAVSSATLDPHWCSNPGTSGVTLLSVECTDQDHPCVKYPSSPEYYLDNDWLCGVRGDFHSRIHEDEADEDFVREWLPDQHLQLLGMTDTLIEYTPLANWIVKLQAFLILRSSDSLIQTDSSFIRFMDSIPGTGIGKWIAIQDSLTVGNSEDALDLLDTWTTDYPFEEDLRQVMKIMLQMESESRTRPDSAETEILTTIAEQCPDSSYLSVHLARGLLMFHLPEDFFHPCENDSLTEDEFWYYDTDSLSSSVLTLYPNPADDICTAEVDASVEGEKIIYVYNTMGHLIEVYPFDEMESSVEMEVGSLTQGIYIILLYADSVFVESKLLSVQHP